MDESSVVCDTKCDDYYEDTKHYYELKVKQAKLQSEIQLAKKQKHLNYLANLENMHVEAVNNIVQTGNLLSKEHHAIHANLCRDEKSLNLELDCHKTFKKMLDLSSELQTPITDNICSDLNTFNNVLTQLANEDSKELIKNIQGGYNVCQQFVDTVNALENPTGPVQHRLRKSQLSDSTVINTFESNNISCSSPISKQ